VCPSIPIGIRSGEVPHRDEAPEEGSVSLEDTSQRRVQAAAAKVMAVEVIVSGSGAIL